ncbi:MAG: alpha-glucosidase [Propionibacteriaceae bacterium]|jgi:oligo-1,6-glucosidase|nr:alpha-glucosidase [Propionibacteriaceae bacterium]
MNEVVRPWWKDAIFYQIYPRSFQDSNGDGIGDIPGIISRLDELAHLGVTCLWLSPVYCSPDADNGYDISDYRQIDSRYGTLEDFDQLVTEAKTRGMRVIMDLVINHTSDEHEWFQASRRREESYSDYYIWRPGKLPDGSEAEPIEGVFDPSGAVEPPNNWTGFFMGSAWEWDDLRGEYYLHLFDKKQPDLNYHNPAVIEEIKQILRFWLDRGIAGFRCDVISLLYKESLEDGQGLPIIRGLEHYKGREGTHKFLQELRREILEPYGAFTVGETVMVSLDEAKQLCDPDRGELDLLFYFDHLEVDRLVARYGPKPFRADRLLERLTTWQQGLEWNALYLENHDQPRIVSHYGDDKKFWARSAQLLAVMLMTLRGSPFLYQGQEIGMTNFDYTSMDDLDDVESHNMNGLMKKAHIPYNVRWWMIRSSSRDNARTPVQWDDSEGAGFTAGTPWMAINANSSWLNYAAQTKDPHSVLNFYRRLIRLRGNCETLAQGGFEPIYANRSVMAYRRTSQGSTHGDYTIWLNFSGRTQRLPYDLIIEAGLDDSHQCMVSNTGRRQIHDHLLPWEAIVLRQEQ